MWEILAAMQIKQMGNFKLALSGIAVSTTFITSLFVLGSLQSFNVLAASMNNESGMMNTEKGMMMNPKAGMMIDNKTGMMVTMNTQTGMIENKTDMMISMNVKTGMPMIDSKTTGEMMNP